MEHTHLQMGGMVFYVKTYGFRFNQFPNWYQFRFFNPLWSIGKFMVLTGEDFD